MGKACAKAQRQVRPLQRANRASHTLTEGWGGRGESPENNGKSSELKGDHWKILNLRVTLPGAVRKLDQTPATVITGISLLRGYGSTGSNDSGGQCQCSKQWTKKLPTLSLPLHKKYISRTDLNSFKDRSDCVHNSAIRVYTSFHRCSWAGLDIIADLKFLLLLIINHHPAGYFLVIISSSKRRTRRDSASKSGSLLTLGVKVALTTLVRKKSAATSQGQV